MVYTHSACRGIYSCCWGSPCGPTYMGTRRVRCNWWTRCTDASKYCTTPWCYNSVGYRIESFDIYTSIYRTGRYLYTLCTYPRRFALHPLAYPVFFTPTLNERFMLSNIEIASSSFFVRRCRIAIDYRPISDIEH